MLRQLLVPVPRHALLAEALDAAAAAQKATEGSPPPTLVFHAESASALTAKNLLEKLGLTAVETSSSIADVFDRLHSRSVRALVVFHRAGKNESLALLRLLNEAPDLGRFPLIVAAPGEEAVKDYALRGRTLRCDRILVPDPAYKDLRAAIEAVPGEIKARKNPDAILDLLADFRLRRGGTALGKEQILKLTEALMANESRQTWALAERVLCLTHLGDVEAALAPAVQLHARNPGSIHAATLAAELEARRGDPEAVATARLLPLLEGRAKLFDEEWRRLCDTMIRMKAYGALATTLDVWHDTVKRLTHSMSFCAAAYLAAAGLAEEEGACLALAVHARPADGRYLQALAAHLARQKSFAQALKAWTAAAPAHGSDPVAVKAGTVVALVALRRGREARESLDRALKEHPGNPVLEALRTP